ncbi:CBS domain-containing protein [Methanococcoides vulcani]|uniref:CBS domain-containing protein n=1 Tax=Methanococcoides vulcani TaxID=1353158 RepID=A0A1I0AW65_9EURY|nr:CBS domain-containing protein [Methanococcoides vulcani]SES98228.1 CBS domain-containing protein [Methanococcoides vulcani]
MKVNEIMSKDAVCIKKHDNITHARQLMRDHFLRGLPVIDEEQKVVGILKDQDVLNIKSTRSNVTVEGYMHDCPLITPETDIVDAAKHLLDSEVSRCPVIVSTENRMVAGILSNSDILANIGSDRKLDAAVADIMTADVITCTPKESLTKVWPVLLESNFSGLPVVSDNSETIGMVTRMDIIRSGFVRTALNDTHGTQPKDTTVVEKIMSTPVYTVSADTSVKECLEKMLHYDVGRMTVLDKDRIVGIVDRTDILRAFVMGTDPVQ